MRSRSILTVGFVCVFILFSVTLLRHMLLTAVLDEVGQSTSRLRSENAALWESKSVKMEQRLEAVASNLRSRDAVLASNISQLLQKIVDHGEDIAVQHHSELETLGTRLKQLIAEVENARLSKRREERNAAVVPSQRGRPDGATHAGGAMMQHESEQEQNLLLSEMNHRLELLELAVHRLLRQQRSSSNSSTTSLAVGSSYESAGISQCSLACHGRGLSVRIPNITDGCECSCVGGWFGAGCQVQHSSSTPFSGGSGAQQMPPPITIPLEREELHHASAIGGSGERERGRACRSASVQYFADRKHSQEFRGDSGVDFFWKLAMNSLPPSCSDDRHRVMIIDVGAHVGQKLNMWRELLLNQETHRCASSNSAEGGPMSDSVVLLVEPNPLNLVVLRDRLSKDKLRMARADTATTIGTRNNRTVRPMRGDVVLADVAAGYYDGEGWLRVDLSANRNKKVNGNERAFLDVGLSSGGASAPRRLPPSSLSSVRHIRVPVRTVATLVNDVPRSTPHSQRPITNISVLKIDAEGLDSLVLYGAADVLPITNVIVFECHKLWKVRGDEWLAATRRGNATNGSPASSPRSNEWWRLKEVVEYLAKAGFELYKVGVFYWLPMTPPLYWDDSYEEHLEWSNCVAVRPGHPLRKVFSTPPPCS